MQNIFVVDDNIINVALYQRVIAAIPGMIARCFTNPYQALSAARDSMPALAVVDYRMPQMDGVQFIRAFRQIRGAQAVPIVMLTSISSPVLWQMALDAGANEYLMKPLDKGQFLACVFRLIGIDCSPNLQAARNGG